MARVETEGPQTILADIGGTNIRLALAQDGLGPGDVKKYETARHTSLKGPLTDFIREKAVSGPFDLLAGIAGIADMDGDERTGWIFATGQRWDAHPDSLARDGIVEKVTLTNDFEATAWSLSRPGHVSLRPLDELAVQHHYHSPACVSGAGTGLGLPYLTPPEEGRMRWQVMPNPNACHMLATSFTDEQAMILRLIGRLERPYKMVAFEDCVSGRGLHNLYKALCLMHGRKARCAGPEEIMGHMHDPLVKAALRLFHEFFGLALHNAVVTGNAHTGVYLCGGLVDYLIAQDLFDTQTIRAFMELPCTPTVYKRLVNTPLFYIDDPLIVLRGLQLYREAMDEK